jgi:hypothetical protein
MARLNGVSSFRLKGGPDPVGAPGGHFHETT